MPEYTLEQLPEQTVGYAGVARYSNGVFYSVRPVSRGAGKLRWYRVNTPSVDLTGGVFMDHPKDILHEFPVRKSKKQKISFQEAILSYCQSLGYDGTVEKGSLGVRNIVIGNPERARYLITAHYDTCAALPFPNLLTPCNLGLFLAWQFFLVILLCVPAGIIAGIIGGMSGSPVLGFYLAYLILLLELIWMLFGPANRHNANDNTSGVVAVLETAAAIPADLRDQVCFVLFDLEEAGLFGSSAYRKMHRKASSRQLILNLDCVGEGDEILLFPTKKLKNDEDRVAKIIDLCMTDGNKSIVVKNKGFAIYPSDQVNFPTGFGIAAFCRSKWAGLYLGKIHTKRDKILDEKNIALLRDFLIEIVRDQA